MSVGHPFVDIYQMQIVGVDRKERKIVNYLMYSFIVRVRSDIIMSKIVNDVLFIKDFKVNTNGIPEII